MLPFFNPNANSKWFWTLCEEQRKWMLFFPFNSWCTFPWQNIAKKIQSTFFGQFFGKPHSKIYTQKERFHALNCPSNYLYFDLKTGYVYYSNIGRWLKTKCQLKILVLVRKEKRTAWLLLCLNWNNNKKLFWHLMLSIWFSVTGRFNEKNIKR